LITLSVLLQDCSYGESLSTGSLMEDEIPLYNASLSQSEFDLLLEEIRSSSYIDEVESGEVPRNESDLWNAVLPAQEIPGDTSLPSLIKHAGEKKRVLAVANDKSGKSVLVIQLKNGEKVDELKVAPKDVIEVCSNLAVASMDLSEVSVACEKAETQSDTS
jgi:hypothetical protein